MSIKYNLEKDAIEIDGLPELFTQFKDSKESIYSYIINTVDQYVSPEML